MNNRTGHTIRPLQSDDRINIGGICLFIIVATAAAYSRVFLFEFVSFDDSVYVYNNPNVTGGLSINGISWAFGFTDVAYWHPFTWLSHMLDCHFFGMNAGYHHLSNLFLHILNAILLFFLFYRMTGDHVKSALVALVFALHPLNVESVAWISERKNLLSTFFYFSAMLLYIQYTKQRGFRRYLGVLLLYSFGLMAKPSIIMLPFILLIIDWWPLRRYPFYNGHNNRISTGGILAEKVPLIVLSFLSFFIASSSAQQHGIMTNAGPVPIILKIGNAIVSAGRYIGKIFWPQDLAVFYPFPDYLPIWLPITTGVALCMVTLIVLIKHREQPFLLTGWFWYLGGLVPVSGLIQGGLWPAMADRWSYIPAIGISVLFIWGVPAWFPNWSLKHSLRTALFTLFFVVLGITTWMQTGHWRDGKSLYAHAVKVTPGNSIMLNNLGFELHRQGEIETAFLLFLESVRVSPNDMVSFDNLKRIYLAQGNTADHKKTIQDMLEKHPQDFGLFYSLGNLLSASHEYPKAIEYYRAAIRIQPDFVPAMKRLVDIFITQKKFDKAIDILEHIAAQRPQDARICYDISRIYAARNLQEDAVKWLRKAVERGFDNWELIRNDKKLENIRENPYYKKVIETQ